MARGALQISSKCREAACARSNDARIVLSFRDFAENRSEPQKRSLFAALSLVRARSPHQSCIDRQLLLDGRLRLHKRGLGKAVAAEVQKRNRSEKIARIPP